MSKKLYFGNLSYGTNDDTLRDICSKFGNVESATVIMDRMSGRSKGFGFVEMSNDEEAQEVVKMLNGKEVDGRAIVVNEAKPQEDRGRSNGRPRQFNRSGGSRNW